MRNYLVSAVLAAFVATASFAAQADGWHGGYGHGGYAGGWHGGPGYWHGGYAGGWHGGPGYWRGGYWYPGPVVVGGGYYPYPYPYAPYPVAPYPVAVAPLGVSLGVSLR